MTLTRRNWFRARKLRTGGRLVANKVWELESSELIAQGHFWTDRHLLFDASVCLSVVWWQRPKKGR